MFFLRIILLSADNRRIMTSQAFLWINISIAVVLILLFIWGRRNPHKPSRLNLRAGQKGPASSKTVSTDVKRQAPSDFHVRSKSREPGEENIKNLNVMFMYNGHSFDAYEVLGLPAGASFQNVKAAYEKIISSPQMHSKDFYEAAFKAIISDLN